MNSVKFNSSFAVILLCLASGVQATPVRWFLTDVVFDDGNTATGSFLYDAALNVYSDISIVTSAGDYLFDYDVEYGKLDSLGGTSTLLEGWSRDTYNCPPYPVCDRFLKLTFAAPLTDSGGTIAILIEPTSYEEAAELLTFNEEIKRFVISGSATTVPVPAAGLLFGAALGLLGWIRRRSAAA